MLSTAVTANFLCLIPITTVQKPAGKKTEQTPSLGKFLLKGGRFAEICMRFFKTQASTGFRHTLTQALQWPTATYQILQTLRPGAHLEKVC